MVIIYPEKYISIPDFPQDEQEMDLSFPIKERSLINETNNEISAASNISKVERIESGNISSVESFHYLERLKDVQDEGVEG